MIKMLDDLVDKIATMHRCGEIDSRSYLTLTAEVLAIKKVVKEADFIQTKNLLILLQTGADVT